MNNQPLIHLNFNLYPLGYLGSHTLRRPKALIIMTVEEE